MIDNDTGDGVVRGRFTVRDPASGRLKLVGRTVGATTGLADFRVQGILDARLVPGGGEFVANATINQNPDLIDGGVREGRAHPPTNKAVISTAC